MLYDGVNKMFREQRKEHYFRNNLSQPKILLTIAGGRAGMMQSLPVSSPSSSSTILFVFIKTITSIN